MRRVAASVLAFFVFAGCTGVTPLRGQDRDTTWRDRMECETLAPKRPASTGDIVGGFLGAALVAGLGVLAGDPSAVVGINAGFGALDGVRSYPDPDAVKACMEARGYSVP